MVSPIEDFQAKIHHGQTGDDPDNENQLDEQIDGKNSRNSENAQATICCKTCASTQQCEEDIVNPGDYYCRCCWEEYAVLSQQQGHEGSSGKVCEDTVLPHQMATEQSEYQASTQPQTQASTPTNPEESPSQRTGTQPEVGGETATALMTAESFVQIRNDDLGANDSSQFKSIESNFEAEIPDANGVEQKDASSRSDNNGVQHETDGPSEEGGDELNRVKSNDTEEIENEGKTTLEPDAQDTDGYQRGVDRASSQGSKLIDDEMAIDYAPTDDNIARDRSIKVDNTIERDSNGMKPPHKPTDDDRPAAPEDDMFEGDQDEKKDKNDGNAIYQSVEDSNSCDDNGKSKPADKLSNNEEETAPAAAQEDAMFECDDDGKHGEDDDQDLSFGTQEMADASRVNGLLTQAGSVSGDDDDINAMDEDVDEKGEETRFHVAAIKATRPPTIDTSEQVPLSGLTGPSQHLPLSYKSDKDNSQLAVKVNPAMKETKLNDGDAEINMAGGTEDTFGSLYCAETQLLPSAKPHSSANGTEEKNLLQRPVDTKTQLPSVNDSKDLSQKQVDLNDGIANGESSGLAPERSEDRIEQEVDNVNVDGETKDDASERPEKHTEQEAENISVDMKVTPQKGVLSMVSYPYDHIENIDGSAKAKSVGINNDHDVDNRESQNQQSQDLLEVSPISRRGEECDKSHKSHTNMREQRKGEDKNESKWMSNCGKDGSPRFVLPALKPSLEKKVEKINHTRPTEDSITADESVDDDSLFGQRNPHPLDSDPIEDTQTQDMHHERKKSSLKRLSRGTPMYPSRLDDSSSGSSSHMFSARASNSSSAQKQCKKMSPFKGSKSIITPKVLQYAKSIGEHVESHSDDEERSYSETNQRSRHFQQSQTNYRALKQLEEVKKFTKMLPSVEELSELSSRKQLLGEISKLRHSHSEEVTSLKKEISNLRKLIRQKDGLIQEMKEEIKEKDETISEHEISLQEKNRIVNEQANALGDLMNKLGVIASPEKQSKCKNASSDDSDDCSAIVLSALKKRPAAATSRKKKHGTLSAGKKHKCSASTKEDTEPRPFSSKIWKVLQDKGWKYKTGPEPYNKVYIPPDGATHRGTTVGIHFFLAEQVIDAATARGHLNGSDGKASDALNQPAEAEKEWSDEQQNENVNSGPMDDSKLSGDSKLITLETGRQCIELSASFMHEESASFMAVLFDPLWQCLKTQGVGNSKLNWVYEKYSSLTRNWCFVPPSSKLGSKGEKSIDFFLSEEELVLKVLQESVKMDELAPLFSKHCDSISKLMPILARAVENDMQFQDALDGKSPRARTRRQASPLLSADKPEPSKKRQRSASPKPKTKSPATGEKRKTPGTTFSEKSRSTAKKKKADSDISPAFHSSQTQRNEVSAPSFSRPSPSISGGPLDKYEFFYSGVDKSHALDTRIKKLGGRVVSIGHHTADTSHAKLFFLSEYTYWRRPKYMLAASLGVPMLHYEWLADLEKKVKEGGHAKVMSSDLYQKHRLPVGLDHSTGVYPLQRASHARDWLRPGFIRSGEGKGIFEGMTIAIAVDTQTEGEWRAALSALGASVITTKSPALKAKGLLENVDCCLLSSASLPPQATSVPVHVSEMMRHIPSNVPRLDLAWAHQSIIQRKRLPLVGNPRYEVSLGENATGGSHKVYSIKRKTARYEVGDLIQFSNNSKITCYGRILSIRWAKLGKSKLEVQLLDKTGDFELTDCPSSAKLNIDESSLDGNIVLLGSKDMRTLGYLPKNPNGSNLFRQVKQMHESQM